MRPVLLGIGGGTASGKTSLARLLQMEVGRERSILLELDAYYRDLTHLPMEDRHRINFDHPDAFDWELLEKHVDDLLHLRPVDVPVYDYATHNRGTESLRVEPRPVVLIEGILVFWHPSLRERMDIKVFVDTPPDLRLLRRIRRDTVERQRSLESILEQYEHRVRPMHDEFCEPTKAWADVIIPRGARNKVAIEMVRARLQTMLQDPGAGP